MCATCPRRSLSACVVCACCLPLSGHRPDRVGHRPFSLRRPRPKSRRRNLLVEACSCAVASQLQAAAAAAPRSPTGQRCCERCGSDFKVETVYTGWPLRCASCCAGWQTCVVW